MGFLVPPRVQQVDLRFPREGIDYDSLSEEEKEQWESLDWGDDVDPEAHPDRVNASAINSWLFNEDTVDKALRHLMEHCHKVDGGDRLAKTILFARNHEHAKFVEKRFNQHYPQHAGHFARVIDHYATYAQSLIDDFSQKNKAPHLAISVDMLDTGIDVPEVANLVFFKPVYSKIKFWQKDGESLFAGLLARSESPSLAHFVRSLVGMDRTAAQASFSSFLADRSLTPPQIRFIEMVIEQLTTRGVIDASALYEPPFTNLHAEGPDALSSSKAEVIERVFEALQKINSRLVA